MKKVSQFIELPLGADCLRSFFAIDSVLFFGLIIVSVDTALGRAEGLITPAGLELLLAARARYYSYAIDKGVKQAKKSNIIRIKRLICIKQIKRFM